jgi:hypothetical protein
MLLGSDIFTPQDKEASATVSNVEHREEPLARVYKASAEKIAPREPDDPEHATHRYARKIVRAWGEVRGPEPELRFRVLAGSGWRPAVLEPSHASFKQQQRAANAQAALVEEGVFDQETSTLTRDHVFNNWTRASHLVSGIGSYAGSWHWQRLAPVGEA